MADNFFGLTDTGRVRTNNEDAFIAQKVAQGRYIAACVIDGVGGYEGGEVAAAIARDSIVEYFSIASGDVVTMMKEAFVVANEKIAAAKKKNPQYESMACVATLSIIDLTAKTFYYAHIGDTRLYLLRDGSLVKISKDHSFVGYLEDSGRLSETEAMQHPKRNEINKALGFSEQLNLPEDIETGSSPFLPGDLLLLCSDGLTDLVNNSEMLATLQKESTLQAKAKTLIQLANGKGGKDNITVVLVRNHRKPVVQKATKPVTASLPVPETQQPVQANTPIPEGIKPRLPQRKGVNALALILGLLCIVLAAALVMVLYNNPGILKVGSTNLAMEKNEAETTLQRSLDTTTAIFAADSLLASTLLLTDTILIRQDSIHIKGNGMRFLKSSEYTGPAFALSKNCKYVLLENLSLENFDIGVLVQNNALHLKNVRFIACNVPVQTQVLLQDNNPVSGTLTSVFTSDTLSK